MRTALKIALLGLVAIGSSPTPSFAWGDLGHEIVCEIAFQEMTPAARSNVKALIAEDAEFKTFAKSCTWPDHPRIRAIEHFVNLDRASATVTEICPEADRCVLSAILNDTRDLALVGDHAEQLRLLKSLGHWVGDLHQPVHVSFADDRGANKIATDDPCNTDLHSVWDSCIIAETIGDDAKAVAIDLRGEITAAERQAWVPAVIDADAVMAWANESFAVTISPDVEYCVKVGTECWYAEGKRLYTGGPLKRVDADDAYLEAHSPIIRQRLKQAGVRLAAILNQVFPTEVAVIGGLPGSGTVGIAPPPAGPLTDVPTGPESGADQVRMLELRVAALEAQVNLLMAEFSRVRGGNP